MMVITYPWKGAYLHFDPHLKSNQACYFNFRICMDITMEHDNVFRLDLDDLVLSFYVTVGQNRSNLNQIEHVCNIFFKPLDRLLPHCTNKTLGQIRAFIWPDFFY